MASGGFERQRRHRFRCGAPAARHRPRGALHEAPRRAAGGGAVPDRSREADRVSARAPGIHGVVSRAKEARAAQRSLDARDHGGGHRLFRRTAPDGAADPPPRGGQSVTYLRFNSRTRRIFSLAANCESTSTRGATPNAISARTSATNVHASRRGSPNRSVECASASGRPQNSEKYIRRTARPVRADAITTANPMNGNTSIAPLTRD